jgi:hypothetical protein
MPQAGVVAVRSSRRAKKLLDQFGNLGEQLLKVLTHFCQRTPDAWRALSCAELLSATIRGA